MEEDLTRSREGARRVFEFFIIRAFYLLRGFAPSREVFPKHRKPQHLRNRLLFNVAAGVLAPDRCRCVSLRFFNAQTNQRPRGLISREAAKARRVFIVFHHSSLFLLLRAFAPSREVCPKHRKPQSTCYCLVWIPDFLICAHPCNPWLKSDQAFGSNHR